MAQIDCLAEQRIEVRGAIEVERARRAARLLTSTLGFGAVDQEMVVLSVSELATNLVRYAQAGCIVVRPIASARGDGVEVESQDAGPGIAHALAEGAADRNRSQGLGAGLAGVERLMDEFELQTAPSGTTVICRKWLNRR